MTEELRNKIFALGNNSLYFDDRHDYRSALWEICNLLKPECMSEEEIGVEYIEDIEEEKGD